MSKTSMVGQLRPEVEYCKDDCDDRDVKLKLNLQKLDNLLDKEVDYFVSP